MAKRGSVSQVDDMDQVGTALVQLARLALAGREQDTALFVQRTARRLRETDPVVADALVGMLRESPTRSSPLRRVGSTEIKEVPVDSDSRLALVRIEDPPVVDAEPILPPAVHRAVRQLVDERERAVELADAGLAPTRTALLLGPPGVGKTLVARWISASLGLPLLVLDLSAVMSSLLGRTGMNLRYVLDYAKGSSCVLLIDELDSIGKRRNDDSDVGELKRLVNVLLQQLDDWPSDGSLLLGATNHPDLLDPAIWRRFEVAVDFPLPDLEARRIAVERFASKTPDDRMTQVLAAMFDGWSFSEIESAMQRANRSAALGYGSFAESLVELAAERVQHLHPAARREMAIALVQDFGVSQRRAHELTGVSRDTIRKAGRQ